VGKKSGPRPPPAPDPAVTAKAQADANIATAREQQRLNLINTAGPTGTVNYEADPNAPGGYRQVTALSKPEQSVYDATKATELGAVNIANDQLGRVRGALETPLSTEGLPGLSGGIDLSNLSPGSGIQSTFDKGGQLQYGFNPGQDVQGQVGGDLNLQRLLGSEAVYRQAASRLDPRFDREESRLSQRLADQGFSQNSEGYRQAIDDFGRGKTDAYNQAIYSSIGAGEDAANALFGRQVAQGQFANDAAGQMYQQNLGQAAFNNQTAGQDFGQNLGAAQFSNQAQQQGFGQNLAATQAAMQNAQFGNEARQQGLQERAYLANTPINQLTGLLSLGQVGTPQGIQYSPTQVANTDVLGAYALNQQAQQSAYQAQMQNRGGLLGGLMSLGSAAIMSSDESLKTNKRLLRTRPDGIEEWTYRYHDDPEGVVRFGVMAQQVRKFRPDLVVRRADGYLAVNYAGLAPSAAATSRRMASGRVRLSP
jgi:hypothetical protein